jgi:hypothetical protein
VLEFRGIQKIEREKQWFGIPAFFGKKVNDGDVGVGEIEIGYRVPATVDSSHECYE